MIISKNQKYFNEVIFKYTVSINLVRKYKNEYKIKKYYTYTDL